MQVLKFRFSAGPVQRRRSEENGALWKDSPAQLAQDVEIIFSMLGYPSDVESVLLGKMEQIEGIQGGTILIDMTTSSPELAKKIELEVSKKDAVFLDAPVSGGDIGARNATLSIMCGGNHEVFQRVLPILQILGKEVAWFGPAGSDNRQKCQIRFLSHRR